MNPNLLLYLLYEAAMADPQSRQQLLDSAQAADPMDQFCQTAQSAGFPLQIGELLSIGEEYSDLQCKSTNGGNPSPYPYFSDAYGAFLDSIA